MKTILVGCLLLLSGCEESNTSKFVKEFHADVISIASIAVLCGHAQAMNGLTENQALEKCIPVKISSSNGED